MHTFKLSNIHAVLFFLASMGLLFLSSCDDDEGFVPPVNEGPSESYVFKELNSSGLAGYVRFSQNDDNSIEALLYVAGTESGNTYPAHIHANSAAEGGDIVITFDPIDGATGQSTTTFSQTDAGASITYDELLNYDGYVNVHRSADDLTVLLQTDIGGNELNGTTKSYPLGGRDNSGNTGTLLLAQRKNGNTLATITLDSLQKLSEGNSHPAHIHANTAAETGPIVIDFNPVDGGTGTSVTHIEATNDGTAINYEGLLEFDGYVNVHQSEANSGTLIVQGDIGANELTGESVTYSLMERAVEGIMGEAVFEERNNGETLVTLSLEGTPEGGEHPAHIHMNTAAEGGGIVVTFNPVNGTTGMSMTNVATTDDGTAITYEELLEYNGYVNVHLSAAELGTIVAQGDIGQNALTGEMVTYTLDSVAVPTIKGEAIFYQRNNGTTLVELMIEGTPADGMHPAHIHANTAAEGGGIKIDLTSVDGATGISRTQVGAFNDGTPVTYEELLEYDGYINVHFSATELGTIVAQGDIGANALTGESVTYALNDVGMSGVSGTATFAQRNDGSTLITLMLTGTPSDGNHPAHIHYNSAEEGGDIAIDLTNVNGATGLSKTSVMITNNNVPITYEELIAFDGYINVHLSPDDLGTIVAQGDIGANAAE
uniref:CHRD domain-containing protein n=1 Tax=Roseihalotalea indica TaxID=2867963 RepID=A0AA49GTN0_9BACT|nr:CHRD domain-containing protein [Tunicatimonas sp. TK19036]